jgi:hypothetical protein
MVDLEAETLDILRGLRGRRLPLGKVIMAVLVPLTVAVAVVEQVERVATALLRMEEMAELDRLMVAAHTQAAAVALPIAGQP